MSEESKKAEEIEQGKTEVKPAELPEQELDKVAGGYLLKYVDKMSPKLYGGG